jgi:protein-S-isoprenylcysteine O-methyltransferase Ste14
MAFKSVKCAGSRVKLKNRQNQFYSQIVAFLQGVGVLFSLGSTYSHLGRHHGLDTIKMVGFILIFPSLLLWTVARIQLGRCCTLMPDARSLVTAGIYSKIRNPVYIFGTTTVFSYILVLGKPIYLLVLFVIVPVQYYRAHKEAKLLESQFGASYRIYAANVWM